MYLSVFLLSYPINTYWFCRCFTDVCLFIAVNIEGKPGACGFVPMLIRDALPIYLIKVDEETGEPLRDSKGLCIMCKPGKCLTI